MILDKQNLKLKKKSLNANMNPCLGYIIVSLACLMSAIGLVLAKTISKQVDKYLTLFYLGLAYIVCGGVYLTGSGELRIGTIHVWISFSSLILPPPPPHWKRFIHLAYSPVLPHIACICTVLLALAN